MKENENIFIGFRSPQETTTGSYSGPWGDNNPLNVFLSMHPAHGIKIVAAGLDIADTIKILEAALAQCQEAAKEE